jgi:hypothetical protein
MDMVGKELGFKNMEDWYKITFKDIEVNGGISLLSNHGGSLSKLVQFVYSEHKWKSSKFKKTLIW